MNISAYILEYLKQFGTVTVPGFGVFSLENSKAIINSENGSILPPASKIVYTPDYEVKSDELAAFIGSQKQMPLEASKTDLQIQTDFWKKSCKQIRSWKFKGWERSLLKMVKLILKETGCSLTIQIFTVLKRLRFQTLIIKI
ncbi:HU domain-containing protein [Chryseobacterium wanjuense]